MKIARHSSNVLDTNLTGNKFGIDNKDAGFILGILREGMYQDPIGTVCREIMSNCWDAHVEAGCTSKPFEVTLPSPLSNEIRFRDYGKGMSPEFMQDGYLKVGHSTKSDTDDQIGGFGLGRLTPWSYSDSFTLEIIYEGVKRIYSCFLEESGRGEAFMMSESPSKEPSGTLVRIPVKSKDSRAFSEKVYYYASYMKVRPVIKGGNDANWINVTKELEGEGWYSIKPTSHRYGFFQNSDATLIVGNVPYRIDKSSLEYEVRNNPILNCGIVIECGIGQVDVAANRENLKYTDKTKDFLREKLNLINQELASKISEKIANCKDLWEASLAYNSLESNIKRLVTRTSVMWGGYSINNHYPVLDTVDIQVFNNLGNNQIKVNNSRYNSSNIIPDDSKAYYLNDYSSSTQKDRIRSIFDSNPLIKEVIVYKHREGPQSTLKIDGGISQETLRVKLLSDVTPAVKPKKVTINGVTTKKVVNRKPKGTVRLMKYTDTVVDASRTGLYTHVEEVIIEPDEGGFYLEVDKGFPKAYNSNSYFAESLLSWAMRELVDKDIYLLRSKELSIVEGNNNWQSIEEEITKAVDKLLTKEFKDYITQSFQIPLPEIFVDVLLKDPRPSLLREFAQYKALCKQKHEEVYQTNFSLYSLVKEKARSLPGYVSKLNEMAVKCKLKYPLLQYVYVSTNSRNGEVLQEMLEYVHLIESTQKIVTINQQPDQKVAQS